MPKKYLTKSDKVFKRVNPEYAKYKHHKQMEASWFNEHRQNVISTLPKRIVSNFASYDFANIITPPEVQSIFISGKAGVGKTVLSAYLYLIFIHDIYIKRGAFAGLDYNFVNFPAFIDLMQNYNGNNIDKEKLMQVYTMCDLLVLDDFGVKKTTDYVYSLIYLIINDRYNNMLPTIINSNHSLAELNNLFEDDRIVRRIEEDYLLIEKTTYKK